ncbi:MAG: NCS2 family permease [Verrucomicrobiota bacterium]
MIERWFQTARHGSSVRTELVAGITTFASMAYILAVNPAILGASGMDKAALITATALASALMTMAMALATNYPIALAPGMGINAFFTFGICLGAKIPWPAALGLVFYGGILFLILSVSGLRQRLMESIPPELKLAITCGIGLFIAFIGLKNGGVIIDHPATLVGLGHLDQAGPLLVLGGLVVAAALVWRKVPGAILLTVIAITIAGLFLKAPDAQGAMEPVTRKPDAWISLPASLSPSFLKLDLGYFWSHWRQCLPILLSLLFVDLFDNMGTLIGVSQRAGLLDAHGRLPKIGRALMADASAAIVGALLGTSTVTSYIESAAGVEAGGRTGLTALTTAACFLLALFLSPLIAIIPGVATAPVLVLVGIFMMQSISELDLRDFSKAVPAVITIIAMPLTFSIAEGIALGFVTYVGFRILTGRARSVPALAHFLGLLFLLHLIFR